MPVAGTSNPDYDVKAHELHLKYYVGDENNPDQVFEFVAMDGHFVIDDQFRDEVRNLLFPPGSAVQEVLADVEVQEADVKTFGPFWYDIMVWIGAAGGSKIVGDIAWAGVLKLKNKLLPSRQPGFPMPLFDGNQAAENRPLVEQSIIAAAKGVVSENYDVAAADLDVLGTNIRQLESFAKWGATVVLRDSVASSYTVQLDWDGGWRMTWIVRSHPG